MKKYYNNGAKVQYFTSNEIIIFPILNQFILFLYKTLFFKYKRYYWSGASRRSAGN